MKKEARSIQTNKIIKFQKEALELDQNNDWNNWCVSVKVVRIMGFSMTFITKINANFIKCISQNVFAMKKECDSSHWFAISKKKKKWNETSNNNVSEIHTNEQGCMLFFLILFFVYGCTFHIAEINVL